MPLALKSSGKENLIVCLFILFYFVVLLFPFIAFLIGHSCLVVFLVIFSDLMQA